MWCNKLAEPKQSCMGIKSWQRELCYLTRGLNLVSSATSQGYLPLCHLGCSVTDYSNIKCYIYICIKSICGKFIFADCIIPEDNLVRMTLNLEVRGKGKKGHPKSTWKGKLKTVCKKLFWRKRVIPITLSEGNVFELLKMGWFWLLLLKRYCWIKIKHGMMMMYWRSNKIVDL